MERIYDILGYKDLNIYQDSSFFSFSLDSIILANYSTIRVRDKKIVDFCTGNAVVPIILTRRCDKIIDCVEIQEKLYDLAVKSIKLNKLENSSKNLSKEKMIARHEICINLDEVCHSANLVLKDNGTFSMIHRTERLIDVISCMKKYNIEPKKIMFIHEKSNLPSNMFLIEGQKNGKSGLKIDKPYILYNEDNTMTDEYKNIQVEVNI